MIPDLVARVDAAVREVAAQVVLPRFRSWLDSDVQDKGGGELVTVADREAERELEVRLRAIAEIPVVGEEACAVRPSLVEALHGDAAWLIDPIDGTSNFVAGTPDWAVMIALVQHGRAVAAWMYEPVTDRMATAERGGGARRDGIAFAALPRPADTAGLRGVVRRRFFDPATAELVRQREGAFGEIAVGTGCAGTDYPALLEGRHDFLLYWRTLPWDHAPGMLLVEEAGGVVARPDGSPFSFDAALGLLVAPDRPTWDLARGLLDPTS